MKSNSNALEENIASSIRETDLVSKHLRARVILLNQSLEQVILCIDRVRDTNKALFEGLPAYDAISYSTPTAIDDVVVEDYLVAGDIDDRYHLYMIFPCFKR